MKLRFYRRLGQGCFASALVVWAACGGDVVVDAPSSGTGGSGGTPPGTSGSSGFGDATTTTGGFGATNASSASSVAASSSSSSSSGTVAVTWTANAAPIFVAKCGPCHTVGGAGGVNFATVYADTQKVPNATAPDCMGVTTVGACTLIRIKDGAMPFGAGCTGNPTIDAGNARCLTAAQQATLQAWITGGEKL
jgi:hypothetical protein